MKHRGPRAKPRPAPAAHRRATARFLTVTLVAFLGLATSAAAEPVAPYAVGDSSANIQLNSSSRLIANRWVARANGTISTLYVRTRREGSSCWDGPANPGYASGDGGVFRASTHHVLADGTPDLSTTLATSDLAPCVSAPDDSLPIPLNMRVTAGDEYVTVLRNVALDPTRDWASQNFLYLRDGIAGANGRNERSASAADSYYGLDPREVVGFSRDGGATWSMPGGPYGAPGGRSFLPTYIQQYSDGFAAGQPYYSSTPFSGPVTMVYPSIPGRWQIDRVGAYTTSVGRATVSITIDGREVADAELSGQGLLRQAIEPVVADRGQTVSISTVAGADALPLRIAYAGAAWSRIMGLGTSFRYFLRPDPAFVSPMGPTYAAPVYPLSDDDPGAAASPLPPGPDPSPIASSGGPDRLRTVRLRVVCPADQERRCSGSFGVRERGSTRRWISNRRQIDVAPGRADRIRMTLRSDAAAQLVATGRLRSSALIVPRHGRRPTFHANLMLRSSLVARVLRVKLRTKH